MELCTPDPCPSPTGIGSKENVTSDKCDKQRDRSRVHITCQSAVSDASWFSTTICDGFRAIGPSVIPNIHWFLARLYSILLTMASSSHRRGVMQPSENLYRTSIPVPSTAKKPAGNNMRMSLAGPPLRGSQLSASALGSNSKPSSYRSQNVNPLLQSVRKQGYGMTPSQGYVLVYNVYILLSYN